MRIVKQLGVIWATLEKWFQLRRLHIPVALLIGFITLICVIQPEVSMLRKMTNQTVLILLVWLVLGVAFLMLRSKRLALVCLSCCAILCLHLKNASNISLAAPQVVVDESSKFTIAHFNLSSIQDNLIADLHRIDELKPDILVFQEFTPQFQDQIIHHYDSLYSDYTEFLRLDDYGQIIFTSLPVLTKDTFLIYNIPVLRLRIQVKEGGAIQLISHYNLPPITTKYKEDSRLVFSQLSDFIAQAEEPVIYMGTLNYVAWDNDLVKFRYNADLNDSRKSFFPSLANQEKSLFYAPVDHIYYNSYLDCIQFKKIENNSNRKIGIRGEYQINNQHEKIYSSTGE